MFLFGASGSVPVFQFGRWWTVLSAGWLHAGLMHIFFNMWAARQLAPATADLYGPGRMVIIYVAGGVAGFLLSSVAGEFFPSLFILSGGRFTVGASASISGLIGAILAYGHRSGSGLARSYAMSNVTMLLIMGFLIPGIDNYAHLGGFGGGYFVARFLDPLTAGTDRPYGHRRGSAGGVDPVDDRVGDPRHIFLMARISWTSTVAGSFRPRSAGRDNGAPVVNREGHSIRWRGSASDAALRWSSPPC